MDTLKDTARAGTATTSQESGQEPVSGEKGTGTATEPFDQGNADGKEGAPPKEGVSGVLDDVKKAASDAVNKGGL
ncbi:hypothetical protein MMC21_002848 [Puttea exsequens]|nr:hypothetical protein [Puttea exsequens]